MLIFAVVSISLALIFYTVAVFWERHNGNLEWQHFVLFVCGLFFDSLGTFLMSSLAGGWSWNIHALTGLVAIILMLVHVVWALVVLIGKNINLRSKFHKFSLIVWLFWLIPFIVGMVLNMI